MVGRGPHVDARAESARAMSPLDAGSMMLLRLPQKKRAVSPYRALGAEVPVQVRMMM